MSTFELLNIYWQMYRSRLFEERVVQIWNDGFITGEIAAIVLQKSIPIKFGRICTNDTSPYSHSVEKQVIPGTKRIVDSALNMLGKMQ